MSTDAPSSRLEGTWAEFLADTRTAVSAWKTVPWLVVIGVLIHGPLAVYSPAGEPAPAPGGMPVIPGGAWVPLVATVIVLLLLALFLFTLGWSGAERITYAWVWSGSDVRFGTAFSAVSCRWRCVARPPPRI